MYDDTASLFGSRRWDDRDEPVWHSYVGDPGDGRLQHLVFVDGRLVDTWTDSVLGSRWEEHARRFDEERRPPAQPPPPRRPAHEEVLDWLCGLVGGREALERLDEEPTPAPPTPDVADPDAAAAYDGVADALDRIAGLLFDDEVARVLEQSLALLWERDPLAVTRAVSPPHVAGALLWVVGRANGLFRGGVTQSMIQRELWLKTGLSVVGQRLLPLLGGPDLYRGHRPQGAPDLMAFAEASLLTAPTRRTLIRWRDQALAAERLVLPPEVES